MRAKGSGGKHVGKGVSRQFGDHTCGGVRKSSGGEASDAKGSTALQLTDRSNARKRPVNNAGYPRRS